MDFLLWIVLGGMVGAIAKLIMPGNDPSGIFITILLGITGVFLGGYISTLLSFGPVTGLDSTSLVIAVGGDRPW